MNSVFDMLLISGLLLLAASSTSLRCYTCSTTTTDRFSKERTVHPGLCKDQNTLGPVVNCTDSREFCAKLTNFISYYNTEYTRPGCMIPKNRYYESSVDDGLKSGGNSICWYERDVHSQKTGDSSCFCNTDLCNGPRKTRVGGRWVVTSGTARWSGSTLALTMICSLSILGIHC